MCLFCVLCADTMRKIKDVIRLAKDKVGATVQQAQMGQLAKQPGMSMMKSFESAANMILNRARTDVWLATLAVLVPAITFCCCQLLRSLVTRSLSR